ncbi:MAG: stage III sporulation protein AG [Bacillota bacterium]
MDFVRNIVKRIKEYIAGHDRKKLIENTAIVAIIGIIIIIAGSTIFSGTPGDEGRERKDSVKAGEASGQNYPSVNQTEEKLKSILSQVEGVGKVDVMITYETTSENVPAYDIKRNTSKTEEKDGDGGTRSIEQEEYDSRLAYEESATGGEKTPVIIKELEPEVRGVLVVAEGVESVIVRERICSAVSVVLDIPAHKVEVIQRKK